METTFPLEDQYDEASFVPNPVGPSSRGCCKVVVGNSCGSGSLVGKRNGKSLILTNAHVAGTRPGTVARCTFPFLNNRAINARLIMAAYSDRVMMDWAVLECDEVIDLPHTKLSIQETGPRLYTAGYPRCQGLTTRGLTHSGTVWRGQPNSIGGQSGSAIHSVADNLQRVVLTWSWAGDCAGQTTKSIWLQYSQRAEIGFVRPPDLIELADVNPDIENGFHSEANITELPIWAHLDEPTDPPKPPTDDCTDKAFRAAVVSFLEELQKGAAKLIEAAGAPPKEDGTPDQEDKQPDPGATFGL
jgi:hypothetical protein